MEKFNLSEHSHRRLNVLTGEWILVSPQRTKRPWQGKTEDIVFKSRAVYDKKCYLCPGNPRADGHLNPEYSGSFVFTNDYSALMADGPGGSLNVGDLLIAKGETGICKVISFSSRHDLTLPELPKAHIKKIIDLWALEYQELASKSWVKYIQIFENKGSVMGCSNAHPHGQIWAQGSLPVEIVKETIQQREFFLKKGRTLLSSYLQLEIEEKVRMVFENAHFAVIVPFWAVWPYETIIISKRHVTAITQFSEKERLSLADAIREITIRYDNVFETSFPYSAGMHQAPVNDGDHTEWHWHMHFYPPLLRSATVKKFMVGYEMLANPQRDITAEYAAEVLRSVSNVHYKSRRDMVQILPKNVLN